MRARRSGTIPPVEAWERKQILGEGGVREENARERYERRVLERSLAGEPFKGRRVATRPHPFHRSAESYVAALGGPLPYMIRVRDIEAATASHERRLEEAWRELARAHARDAGGFARRWRETAAFWNFTEVNELIERHNRFYPAEARLPMDPKSRDYALVNGQPYRRRPLDAAWVLERFPPALAAAAA